MVVGVILMVRLLPLENGVRWLTDWVNRLGIWGPIVFGLGYILAAILFVPGLALTLAAGAIFGLLWGTVIVSIASTIAAAIAFLIGRYLARGAIERQARRYPKFGAIDKAVGEGGWKIIALLRLSPAIPFSAGNYLFGLTAIRFWPYVLASWLFMLPGTFMYVYLGYLGRTSVAGAGRTSGQWALLIVGLLATIAVTVYVTYLARKAMRGHIADATEHGASASGEKEMRRTPTIRSAVITALLAVLVVVATACSYMNQSKIRSLFGPPSVTLKETYQEKPGGPAFDHSAFDQLLKKYVAEGGWVDYQGLRGESDKLDRYIASLADAPFDQMGRDEKLALLIDGYNAFTLRLILDYYPIKSIKDIPSDKRWDDKRWKIAGHTWSLNQIEHEQIRPKFKEPRVHFALVCAAIGCPPLRSEAYVGSRVNEQLEDQARYVHTHDRWFKFEPDKNVVHLTSLYKWYGSDFEQVAGSVLNFAARYSPQLKAALDAGRKPKVEWLDYDWTLNGKENRR
jgi:uncharacterized membrane protein YdjX (TVP38/TMEM64 family)